MPRSGEAFLEPRTNATPDEAFGPREEAPPRRANGFDSRRSHSDQSPLAEHPAADPPIREANEPPRRAVAGTHAPISAFAPAPEPETADDQGIYFLTDATASEFDRETNGSAVASPRSVDAEEPPRRSAIAEPPAPPLASVIETDETTDAAAPSSTAPIDPASTDPATTPSLEQARRPMTWPFRAAHAIASVWEWCLGAVSMIFVLSALSTIPLLQMLSLGYLLEVVGRMVRTGKFVSGFVGIRTFARIGSAFFGTWAILIPLRVLADFSHSAHLIAPESGPSRLLAGTLLVCTVLGVVNIVMAWAAGGRLRHFFWFVFAPPFFAVWCVRGALRLILKPTIEQSRGRSWFARFADDLTYYHPLTTWFPPAVLLAAVLRGRPYAEARDAVWNFVASLRLPYYFWLGLRGFVGTILWLAFPVILLMGGSRLPVEAGVFSALIGGILFGLVILYLPFLQARFAAENRFAAMFDVMAVRRAFNRAPFLFWLGIFMTLALALPLYLLKIEMPPREFGWVESLFFVASMYPARLLTGWAMTRGARRERPRFFLFRWISRLSLVPIAAVFTLFVFLTQYFCWYGSWSLFEQHAVLVPTPFLSF